MTRSALRAIAMGLVAALALFVAACGSDSKSGSTTSSNGNTKPAPAKQGKQGGVLKQLGSSDVDYLDPGHTYYTGGYQVAYATNRPLYNFKPGDATPVPDLAEGD